MNLVRSVQVGFKLALLGAEAAFEPVPDGVIRIASLASSVSRAEIGELRA